MPVSNHCAVSALDRRVLGIRGPECPETRPAFEEPEKNKCPVSCRRKYPAHLGRKRPSKKSVGQPGFGRRLDAARCGDRRSHRERICWPCIPTFQPSDSDRSIAAFIRRHRILRQPWRGFRTRHPAVYVEIEAACAVNHGCRFMDTYRARYSCEFLYFAN